MDQNNRYKLYLDNISDVITVFTQTGTVIYQSPALFRVTEFEPQEIEGKNLMEFVHPLDWPNVFAIIGKGFLNLGDIHTIKLRFKRKNGTWVWLESIGKATKDSNGNIIGIASSHDITARMNIEEILNKRTHELEEMNKLMIGRELKMVELKKELEKIKNNTH